MGEACRFVETHADFLELTCTVSVDVFALRCSGLVTALIATENAPPEAAIRLVSSSLKPTNGRNPRPVAKSGVTGMFEGTFGAVRLSLPEYYTGKLNPILYSV